MWWLICICAVQASFITRRPRAFAFDNADDSVNSTTMLPTLGASPGATSEANEVFIDWEFDITQSNSVK